MTTTHETAASSRDARERPALARAGDGAGGLRACCHCGGRVCLCRPEGFEPLPTRCACGARLPEEFRREGITHCLACSTSKPEGMR